MWEMSSMLSVHVCVSIWEVKSHEGPTPPAYTHTHTLWEAARDGMIHQLTERIYEGVGWGWGVKSAGCKGSRRERMTQDAAAMTC